MLIIMVMLPITKIYAFASLSGSIKINSISNSINKKEGNKEYSILFFLKTLVSAIEKTKMVGIIKIDKTKILAAGKD